MKTKNKLVVVNDKMQKNYKYVLVEPVGKNFHPDFRPDLTPKEMLEIGVFGGKYMTDCKKEFPRDWFSNAKISPKMKDPSLNFFKVDASQSLSVWQKNGWISKEDPRGWFQWYCRYFIGRRIPDEDLRQVKRWKAFRRHLGQIVNKCRARDFSCNTRQRQALLHWAYDSRRV